jgi:hypothetical protein
VFKSQVASVCVSHGKLISYLATQKSVVENVLFHGTRINPVGQSSVHIDHIRVYQLSHVIVVVATAVFQSNTTVSNRAASSVSQLIDNTYLYISLVAKLEPVYAS